METGIKFTKQNNKFYITNDSEIQKGDNILYKIGDKAALDIYKEYLGKYADQLPGAALLFPLSMRITEDDEEDQSE